MIITPDSYKEVLTTREEIERVFPNAVFVEGFDHCIVDVSMVGSVVYSVNKIIATLMSGNCGYCERDAYTYLDYLLIPQYSELPLSPKYK